MTARSPIESLGLTFPNRGSVKSRNGLGSSECALSGEPGYSENAVGHSHDIMRGAQTHFACILRSCVFASCPQEDLCENFNDWRGPEHACNHEGNFELIASRKLAWMLEAGNAYCYCVPWLPQA